LSAITFTYYFSTQGQPVPSERKQLSIGDEASTDKNQPVAGVHSSSPYLGTYLSLQPAQLVYDC